LESFTSIDFTSRDCKTNEHQSCKSLWGGLGIIARCNCECHKRAAATVSDSSNKNPSRLGEILN